ncbi:hypothetical protein D3C85_855240 [compost metagenome]
MTDFNRPAQLIEAGYDAAVATVIDAGSIDGGSHGLSRQCGIALRGQPRFCCIAQAQRHVAMRIAVVLGDVAFGVDLIFQRAVLVVDLVADRAGDVAAHDSIPECVVQYVGVQRYAGSLPAGGDAGSAVGQQVVRLDVVDVHRGEYRPDLAAGGIEHIAGRPRFRAAIRFGARNQVS